jgi:hypothetical protein
VVEEVVVAGTDERCDTSSSKTHDRRVGSVSPASGVVILLVAALALLGLAPLALPESYSWVEYGTSESAAQGIDGAWIARGGFILYGLAVVLLVAHRARTWGPLASVCHLCFGVSMFAVAAFSTRPWQPGATYVASEDLLHSVFAGIMGIGFVTGVATLIVVRRHRSIRAAAPDVIVFAVTLIIPLFMDTSIWGVLQRVMFVVAAIWYGSEAMASVPRTRPER